MSVRRRVAVVVGTRPEVIKMAPVLDALRETGKLRVALIGTAQHRGLMRQALRAFGLRLDYDLDVMRPGQDPGDVLAAISRRLPAVLRRLRPELLLVQGDTTSALAAALCARRRGIPVAHVEAGLRSHDMSRPFPEEMNRVLIDRIASLHFAPTALNRRNLLAEGVPAEGIRVVGNTVVDALRWTLARPAPRRPSGPLARFMAAGGRRALLTVHRRESFGRPLGEVFRAMKLLLAKRRDLSILYPVHPNPAVRARARAAFLCERRMLLCPPLDHPRFLRALARADLVLSDSGGVQEESLSLGIPLLVLREVTDRPEALGKPRAELVRTRPGRIVRSALRLLAHPRSSPPSRIYGDGRAADRIASAILESIR